MKLIDRIGIAANNIDRRLINLLKDVPVIDFEESYRGEHDLRKTIVIGNEAQLPIIFQLVEKHGLSFLVQKKT
jgi:hypothetical protein